ncbi:MAG: T9SS type A sorting domain-containing protein, partial [Candidatus Cloacimonetes bacterium]|nr:T9SS type A sorting domain-containing protein [Candidatus Cloacimonadota bacterium]
MVTGNIEVVVDITGTVVTFSSPENWFGTETLTFTVNDNVTDLTAEDYVDVLVTPVNDEPILISYLPETLTFTVSQDSIVTFIVNVEDIDSDLTYEWYIDEVMQQVTSEEFIYQFVDLGEIEVKSVVSDEEYSIIMTWSVTVEPLSESGEIIPIANALFQNHPNPFNPMTTIRYSLIEAGKVTINIYNIKGELIKTLINGNYQAGDHQVIWDGRDDSGRIISSGVYFYHMLTDQYSSTRKMILMK